MIQKILSSPHAAPWWRRSRREEYFPSLSVDNASVQTFMAQFGWKMQLLGAHRKDDCSFAPSGPRSDAAQGQQPAAEVVRNAAAASLCRVVVGVRRAVAPLRASVGWSTTSRTILSEVGVLPFVEWMLPGLSFSTSFFFDAHLTCVTGLVVVPLLAQRLLRSLLCRKPRTGVGGNRSRKMKMVKAKKE